LSGFPWQAVGVAGVHDGVATLEEVGADAVEAVADCVIDGVLAGSAGVRPMLHKQTAQQPVWPGSFGDEWLGNPVPCPSEFSSKIPSYEIAVRVDEEVVVEQERWMERAETLALVEAKEVSIHVHNSSKGVAPVGVRFCDRLQQALDVIRLEAVVIIQPADVIGQG
jgi:hypothetical protein